MIVSSSANNDNSLTVPSGGGPQPSQAELLMALATMHKQGAFQVAGDVVDKSAQFGAAQKDNRYNNAGGFREGAPSAKVLPLKPKGS